MTRFTGLLLVLLLTTITWGQDIDVGLMAYFPFDGNTDDAITGKTIDNVSSTSLHNNYDSPGLIADKDGVINQATSFSGNQTLDYGNNWNLGPEGITMSVWVKRGVNTERAVILGRKHYSQYKGFLLMLTPEGNIASHIYTYGHTPVSYHVVGGFIPEGEWHHVAYVINRVTSAIQIYIDGQLSVDETGKTDEFSKMTFDPAYMQFVVGGMKYNTFYLQAGYSYKGELDEIRLYDRPITREEVLAIYSQGVNEIDFVAPPIVKRGETYEIQASSPIATGYTWTLNNATIKTTSADGSTVMFEVDNAVDITAVTLNVEATLSVFPGVMSKEIVIPVYQSQDITQGLMAYFPFDGNTDDAITGKTIDNVSSTSLHNNYDSPGLIADKDGVINQATSFSGNQTLDYGNNWNLGPEGITMSVWVKRGVNTERAVILGRKHYSQYKGFLLMLTPEGNIASHIYTYGHTPVLYHVVGGFIPEGEWHHVAYVINRVTSAIQIYIDGQLSVDETGKTDEFSKMTFDPAYMQFVVGGMKYNTRYLQAGYSYKGELDEIRLYDRPITGNEVATIYALGVNKIDLVAPSIVKRGETYEIQASSPIATGYTWTLNNATIKTTSADGSTVMFEVDNAVDITAVTLNVEATLSVFPGVMSKEIVIPVYQSQDITQGLMAYFPFDGNTDDAIAGVTIDNVSSNNVNGNPPNLTSDKAGVADQAYSFSDNQVLDYNNEWDMGPEGITMSVWVKRDINNKESVLLGRKYQSRDRGFQLRLTANGEVASYIDQYGHTPASYQVVGGFIPVGEWHHVICVINKVTSSVQIYIDGLLSIGETGKTTEFQNMTTSPAYMDFLIGGIKYNTNQVLTKYSYNGELDEIRLYDRPITKAEALGVYSYEMKSQFLSNLKIEGPTQVCRATDINYEIFTENGVTHHWSGSNFTSIALQDGTIITDPTSVTSDFGNKVSYRFENIGVANVVLETTSNAEIKGYSLDVNVIDCGSNTQPVQYALLKEKLDGAYVGAIGGQLYFYFKDRHHRDLVEVNVFDYQRNKIITQTLNRASNNKYSIDVSSLSTNALHTLEVLAIDGVTYKLRIKK